jgi:predicted acyltransferase
MGQGVASAPDAKPGRRPRLASLDAFRGATIGAMILVNNPGSWSAVYPPLRHAAWHGCTPTDLIFPFFLFIVGTAMAFSLPRHLEGGRPGAAFWGRVLRRVGLLIALGLLLNGFMPAWNALASWDWSVAQAQWASVRFPGVLQRIGLVYLLACVLAAFVHVRWQAAVCAGVLIAYPLALWLFNRTDPFLETENLVRWFDRAVIPEGHLYRGSPTDPEGLLSTLPALVSTMMGYWCGLVVRSRVVTRGRCLQLILAGAAVAGIGWAASWGIPLNKPLWTSSYVLFTGGWAIAGLGLFLLAFDLWKLPSRGALVLLGRHAITVFVGSGILARILILVPGPGSHPTVKAWITSGLDALLPPLNASLGFAVLTVGVWWLIAWGLDRAGIVLKV